MLADIPVPQRNRRRHLTDRIIDPGPRVASILDDLGTVSTVKSAGDATRSSSHVTGIETGAPGSGRGLQAEAMVRSRRPG